MIDMVSREVGVSDAERGGWGSQSRGDDGGAQGQGPGEGQAQGRGGWGVLCRYGETLALAWVVTTLI